MNIFFLLLVMTEEEEEVSPSSSRFFTISCHQSSVEACGESIEPMTIFKSVQRTRLKDGDG